MELSAVGRKTDSRNEARRNLVIVRAGDTSLHPTWLPKTSERSWDLVVSYFGDDPEKYRDADVVRIDGKGPKWRALHTLLVEHLEWLDEYDYVWLPDDDIAIAPNDIEQLFETMRANALQLAQPALTTDSFFQWWITLRNPLTSIRWTDYVETMVPCFASSLLKECLPLIGEYISGWGLDWVWARRAGIDARRVAIIDRICAKHTRPFGGPNYRFFQHLDYDAGDEMGHVFQTHGIKDFRTEIVEFVTHWGTRHQSTGTLGKFILRLGHALMVLRAYATRNHNRWDVRRHFTTDGRFARSFPGPDASLLKDGSRYVRSRGPVRQETVST